MIDIEEIKEGHEKLKGPFGITGVIVTLDSISKYTNFCSYHFPKLLEENAKLKAELEKSQCMLAGFMVAEDQEKARLKERVTKLENVREAAQETYQVLCIEHGYRKAEVNFGYLSKALKNCEATDDKQD